MIEKNGGPAFPHTPEQLAIGCEGMSMRDYFAAQALAGFISRGSLAQAIQERITDSKFAGDPVSAGTADIAEGCYRLADALLKERAK